jgi:V/A-type H+-transporting ATPase subunit C
MIRESWRFTALERLLDNALMEYAKGAKYISFGIEPLAAYLIAKEGEMRTVRIAMTGLIQGLSREMMAERLRETYV